TPADTETVSPGFTATRWPLTNTPCSAPVPCFSKPPSTTNHGSYATASLNSGSSHLFTGDPGSAVINGFTGGAIRSTTTRSGPRQNGDKNDPVIPTTCL